jgi:anti-sigma regulatory factor (Ser/Thr protein kinase)
MTELAADRGTSLTQDGADALVLESEIAAMARLPEWVDALALRHGLPDKIRFDARLCLEESISNSIRHGYRETPGHEVRVSYAASSEPGWTFTVEDDAPYFNPLDQPVLPAISPEHFVVGGQGIRLMRAFSTSLDYEETPTGNRLHIHFAPPA